MLKKSKAATIVQAHIRMHKERKLFQAHKNAAIILQVPELLAVSLPHVSLRPKHCLVIALALHVRWQPAALAYTLSSSDNHLGGFSLLQHLHVYVHNKLACNCWW